MAKRTVKNLSMTVPAFPDYRHHGATNPGTMLPRKCRRCQNMIRGVDVHVILLGFVVKILDPLRDWIGPVNDINPVGDDISRMGNPLSTRHKLVIRIRSKT